MTDPIIKQRKDDLYYWVFPLPGRDLFSADAFKTEDEAWVHFKFVQKKMAARWIKDLDAALADRSASELIIETQRERIHGLRRWILALGIALLSQALYIVTLLR